MTFPFPFGNKPEDSDNNDQAAAQPRRRRRSPLLITIVILFALGLIVVFGAQVYTEVLWFQQVGYTGVFTKTWLMRIALFVVGFLVMALATWGSLRFAYNSRPIYAPTTPSQQALYQYQNAIEPLRRMLQIVLPIVFGIFAGGAITNAWSTVLLFFNRQPFGIKDPQFHLDDSFYVFTLPLVRGIVSFLMAVVFISLLCAVVTQYLYGGLRFGGKGGFRITAAARGQIGVGAALFCLLIGANYWLDRYSLLVKNGTDMTGATYTDINALLPARTIMAGIALVVVVLFVLAAIRGTWRLPVLGVGLMVIAAVVVGGIYPAMIQQFRVKPNEQALETPYIQRNIDATMKAYQLDKVETTAYSAKTEATPGALRQDAEATASIRLLDPTIVSPAFRQLQQNKPYYNFAPQLSVDRYEIEGESRDTVIAVRELNQAGIPSRNWINTHTVYTHGYGVVAAYGNTTGPDGEPAFYEDQIPPRGSLGKFEPRIYFGEGTDTYAIVGAPGGTSPWELDYPDDEAPNGQKLNTYAGDGGPSVGNFFNRAAFAIRMGSTDILFSDRVTSNSQILFDRNPVQRVQKVAPYLTLDERVYPAVVDGRVVWMIDGYTSSNSFPYAQMTNFEEATADSQNRQLQAVMSSNLNYIRNSVKATVDAYSGKVTLYAWDTSDPILKAWMGIYPGVVKPMSDISSDLMSHIRYPEDMFKIQRQLLARYHVTDASSFFNSQGFWQVPDDPATQNKGTLQPPYYLTLRMPSQKAPTFSLTTSFIPIGQGTETDRNVLTGFLSADADAGNTAGKPSADYGKLRLLQLPQGSTVPGPGQAENKFTSNTTVANQLNILRNGNTVTLGNLLTLPVGGGLLYVQPVYVQASSGTQYPLLKKVLVSFGESIGYADTLNEALDQVFGGDSGAQAGDAAKPTTPGATPAPTGGTTPTPAPTATPTPGQTATPTPAPTAPPGLQEALKRAQQAMTDSDNAMRSGDWTAYGQAQTRLQQALADALAAEGGASGTPTPNPSPTP